MHFVPTDLDLFANINDNHPTYLILTDDFNDLNFKWCSSDKNNKARYENQRVKAN